MAEFISPASAMSHFVPAFAVYAASALVVEYIAPAHAVVAATYAGGGEHRVLLAVFVMPEPAVCAAPTPVAKSFRCVCRVRGAGTRSVVIATASGRAHFAMFVVIETPAPSAYAVPGPVAEYIPRGVAPLAATLAASAPPIGPVVNSTSGRVQSS